MNTTPNGSVPKDRRHWRAGMFSITAGVGVLGGVLLVGALLMASGKGAGDARGAAPRAQDATRGAVRAVAPAQPLLVQNLRLDAIREIPEEVLNQPIQRVQQGEGDVAVGPGVLVYENDIVPVSFVIPGAGAAMADDWLLVGTERELFEYSGVLVFSQGALSALG